MKIQQEDDATLDACFTWYERMRLEAIGLTEENIMRPGVSQTRCLLYSINPFISLLHPNLGLLCLYMRASCSKMPYDSDSSRRLKRYTSSSFY